jgi:hypothetical protein
MQVAFNLTQKTYLDMLKREMQEMDTGSFSFSTRFAIHDPTTKKTKYDYVKVTFLSSGESEADFCASDIALLSIKQGTGMT